MTKINSVKIGIEHLKNYFGIKYENKLKIILKVNYVNCKLMYVVGSLECMVTPKLMHHLQILL